MKRIYILVLSAEWQSKYIEDFLQLQSVLGPEGRCEAPVASERHMKFALSEPAVPFDIGVIR
jgi:hypothetical protein